MIDIAKSTGGLEDWNTIVAAQLELGNSFPMPFSTAEGDFVISFVAKTDDGFVGRIPADQELDGEIAVWQQASVSENVPLYVVISQEGALLRRLTAQEISDLGLES